MRTKRIRRVALASVAVIVAGLVTSSHSGATGVSSATARAPAESGEPATITFMNWFYEGPMKEAYDGYIASFQEAQPLFEGANVETHPFVQYNDVLNVRLSSGDPPDVAWILNALAPTFVGSGRLVDLMPYIEATPDFNLEDFDPAALAPWQDGDALYALPFTNATNIVYFNADLFEAAGIPTPLELYESGDWTWDTLRSSAAQLVEADTAAYGFVHGNNIFTNTWRVLVDLYAAYGALPWSEDGTTCLFNSAETVAATQLVHDMIFADESHPGPGVAFDFAAGDIGMSLQRQNFAGRLAEVPFAWDVVPAPSGPAGFVPSIAQNGIAAFADAEHPELAAEFVVHTLTPENAALFAANTPSARQSLQTLEALEPVNDVLTSEQLERAVLPSIGAETVQMEFAHPNYLPIEAAAQRVFDGEIWVPDADVAAALGNVCGAIEPLMAS